MESFGLLFGLGIVVKVCYFIKGWLVMWIFKDEYFCGVLKLKCKWIVWFDRGLVIILMWWRCIYGVVMESVVKLRRYNVGV